MIGLEVFAPTDDARTATPRTKLLRASDRQWNDPANKLGTGSVQIDVSDADLANISHGDYVVCTLGGEFADGSITAGSPNLTSPSAVFVAADVGREVRAVGVVPGATIASRTSATVVVLSANATKTVVTNLGFEIVGRTDAYAWIVEVDDRAEVDEREEAGQRRKLSGKGRASVLSRVRVYPERGVDRRTPDTRAFGWTSAAYDAAGVTDTYTPLPLVPGMTVPFGYPTPIASHGVGHEQQTARGAGPWDTYPDDCPSVTAKWVCGVAGSPNAVGDFYMRKVVSCAEGRYAIFITADDGYELFVDSVRVSGEQAPYMWEKMRRVDVDLDGGLHVFAIHHRNTGGPGAVIAAMLVGDRNDSESLGAVIWETDGDWSFLQGLTPDQRTGIIPPGGGVTFGRVMSVLMAEARSRGTLTGGDLVTCAFDSIYDSYGQLWHARVDPHIAVGKSYLEVLDLLVDLGCDWRMDVRTNTLYLANVMGADRNVYYLPGVNIAHLDRESNSEELTNVGLARIALDGMDKLGWVEVSDAASVSAYRRRESLLNASDQDPATIRRAADLAFGTAALPREQLTMEGIARPELSNPLFVGSTPEYRAMPYVDYLPADHVRVSPVAGETVKVLSLGIAEDLNGQVQVVPELGTAIDSMEERLGRLIASATPSTLKATPDFSGGASKGPEPVLESPISIPAAIPIAQLGDFPNTVPLRDAVPGQIPILAAPGPPPAVGQPNPIPLWVPADPADVLSADTLKLPAVRVRRTTNQTITANTITSIVFDSEVYDYGGFWVSGAVVTIVRDALYDLTGSVSFSAPGAADHSKRAGLIWLNGTSYIAISSGAAIPSDTICFNPAVVGFPLVAGDTIQLRAWQKSGGDLDAENDGHPHALSLSVKMATQPGWTP